MTTVFAFNIHEAITASYRSNAPGWDRPWSEATTVTRAHPNPYPIPNAQATGVSR